MNTFTQWNLQVLLLVIPEDLSPHSFKWRVCTIILQVHECLHLDIQSAVMITFPKWHIIGYHWNKKVITLMHSVLVSSWWLSKFFNFLNWNWCSGPVSSLQSRGGYHFFFLNSCSFELISVFGHKNVPKIL